ncbi:BofC C-terminal domain-containing protein [Candidatus Soleaferrea massiliensis]|uniref:BofC C-terminal domain-containing protein n=1 Tax=Candidatus Soleaferrea massiliensis TaxID=1470354 RepID=UPI0018CD8277|nr:BofC C-terminal domain-containing protein [Candidatus Soleaferrea massiliensis]
MKFTICGVLLAVMLLSVTFIIGLNFANHADSQNINEISGVEYVLKDYDGRLAVFKSNQQKPEIVFNVYTSNLPQYDQDSLQKGVAAKDIQELNRLIEDYIS